jgi:hypothetical protein
MHRLRLLTGITVLLIAFGGVVTYATRPAPPQLPPPAQPPVEQAERRVTTFPAPTEPSVVLPVNAPLPGPNGRDMPVPSPEQTKRAGLPVRPIPGAPADADAWAQRHLAAAANWETDTLAAASAHLTSRQQPTAALQTVRDYAGAIVVLRTAVAEGRLTPAQSRASTRAARQKVKTHLERILGPGEAEELRLHLADAVVGGGW